MGDQCIYITGAGSGLGLEIACRFARQGTHLALFDLNVSEPARLQIETACVNSQQKTTFYQVDVVDADALKKAVDQAAEQVGLPALALNCAGVNNACGPFETLSQAQFERTVQINLFGSRNFAEATLPHLKKAAKSLTSPPRLVFIASLAGLVGNYGYAPYCASKFGVVGLAQTLRIELKPLDIKVQVICPPEVDTPMVHEEHKTIHPVTLKLKLMAGALSLEQAVNEIMRGMQRNGFYIIPGMLAKITFLLDRFIPGFMTRKLVDSIVARNIR